MGEPSSALFRTIRWRLTFWYSGVLALTLLLFGVSLYAGAHHMLLDPIQQSLQYDARVLSLRWQAEARFPAFPPGGPCHDFAHDQPLFVCYDADGMPDGESRAAADAPHFDDPTLVQKALQNGVASDTVSSADVFGGTIQRYAMAVPDPEGGGVLGVVQVGSPIGADLNVLDALLQLLLALGLVALLSTSIGGLLLAHRALLPARLAYARQRNFIADASHELRTPLTMLRADAEVLLRGRARLAPDDIAILEDVVAEASHMAALANSMLDLARLDVGGPSLEQEVVDLAGLAEDLARRAGPLAAQHGVTVRAQDEGPTLVVGDRLLLEQAAIILVDNAIKYNRASGEVILRAFSHGDQAHLEVRDTGIGIGPEHLAHLGERFYRVDKARSREGGGAGLGLSIARSIAARHRGSLQLASEPGRGTTATLLLPTARSRRGAAAP